MSTPNSKFHDIILISQKLQLWKHNIQFGMTRKEESSGKNLEEKGVEEHLYPTKNKAVSPLHHARTESTVRSIMRMAVIDVKRGHYDGWRRG